jgi:hypothetical protein
MISTCRTTLLHRLIGDNTEREGERYSLDFKVVVQGLVVTVYVFILVTIINS